MPRKPLNKPWPVRYLVNVLIALDQLANALTGGDEDETISSRLGKARERGSKTGARLADLVDWLAERLGDGPDHCARAIERDEGHNQITEH